MSNLNGGVWNLRGVRTLMSCAAIFISLLVSAPFCFAIGQEKYVETAQGKGDFTIAAGKSVGKSAANVYVDADDFAGVVRAVGDLQADIGRVTDCNAAIVHDQASLGGHAIIVGTIGKSRVIDQLIHDGKIDPSPIVGKWESFFLQVVEQPMPGVANALVIVGSDKRGTIYGIYDLSEQMGVSPWYWWADVPVVHKDALFVKAGKYVQGPPAVKYRGIFLNDEAPSLSRWAEEKCGGFNHEFYEKIFELVLRLKGNYLWPAMWDNAFNEDDPLDPKLADEYGIVMGTSHHEPMLRAQQEWKRHGKGPWNYATNGDELRAFWDEGVNRNKDFESIITIGMRGDGDMPMVEGGDMAANMALLERIVADQRKIIANRVNPDLSKVPQLWALYKEVQEYYEKGMRVPDDVTLLWCDDNWGNIRRLPTEAERSRSGGAGIYYHFDYVGGPRNYKWNNTNPISKVWEQMELAYNYGANQIWIVNVGSLKTKEFPIEYFLNLAWNPAKWTSDNNLEYTRMWAEREFGAEHAAEIADLISTYTKCNGRRKPELLSPDTFSVVNYGEADRVAADFKTLTDKAEAVQQSLPDDAKDAFYELVLYPAKAYATVADLYIAVAKNRLYATQGRASANDYAEEARGLFKANQDMSDYYNLELAHGKWDHMMDQTRIGYRYWQQPPRNVMPKVATIDVPTEAKMGVAVEGSALAWPEAGPGAAGKPVLAEIDSFNRQSRFIDVFNRGKTAFQFSATAVEPWIVLSESKVTVEKDLRLMVSVDWTKAPAGSASGSVVISGPNADLVTVTVNLVNPTDVTKDNLDGFVETDGYVSIEAEHFTGKVDSPSARWDRIEDYGRTLSAMTIFPNTAASVTPPENAPCLQYRMYLENPGAVEVFAMIAPTQAFVPGRGLRFAVSFDDDKPHVIDAMANIT
ncbi:MAG TPA: glycosyl hydrolase 115 family protein, partial [Tepidisphaeraceae bacterium]